MKATNKNAYTWRWVQSRHKKSLAQRQKDEAEMLARYEISAVFIFLFLCCFLPGIFLALFAAVGLAGFGALWVYFHYFDLDKILEDYIEPYTPVEWLPRPQRQEPKQEVRPESGKLEATAFNEETVTIEWGDWSKHNQ